MDTSLFTSVIIPLISIVVSVILAYITALYAIRRELTLGKLQLLDLIRRYFLCFWNAFDRETKKALSNPVHIAVHLREMKAIANSLQQLIAHPFFAKLIIEYPSVSKLIYMIERDIVWEEQQPDQTYVSTDTLQEMYFLHNLLCELMPKKWIDNKIDRDIQDIYNGLLAQGILPKRDAS